MRTMAMLINIGLTITPATETLSRKYCFF